MTTTTESGLITMNGADEALHLPPGQTPITSPKKIRRIRATPATVGFVDDEIGRLAQAMLMQYGPLSQVIRELMLRQIAVENFIVGETDIEQMKTAIVAASMANPQNQTPPAVDLAQTLADENQTELTV